MYFYVIIGGFTASCASDVSLYIFQDVYSFVTAPLALAVDVVAYIMRLVALLTRYTLSATPIESFSSSASTLDPTSSQVAKGHLGGRLGAPPRSGRLWREVGRQPQPCPELLVVQRRMRKVGRAVTTLASRAGCTTTDAKGWEGCHNLDQPSWLCKHQ